MGQPALLGTPHKRPRLRTTGAAIAAATAILAAGCGGDDAPQSTAAAPGSTAPVSWTLVLDYEPNAVHAGLLLAEREGYFDDAGIDLDIVAPSSTSDALTQVTRGRAELGLADLIDVARRNERASTTGTSPEAQVNPERSAGVSLAGAIVQRPLSGLLVDADGPIDRPEQLAGKRIAVSGLPSDEAVVAAIVRRGETPLPVEAITLGFNGLKALEAGRVDASTAYWPADEVTLERLGTKARTFALDEFGGPAYPGLVAFSSREVRTTDPGHVQAFADALARGTREVVADPAAGLAAVQKSFPELDASITEAQLQNYLPLLGQGRAAGRIDPAALAEFAAFAAESGLTERTLTAAELLAAPPESVTP